MIGSPKVIIMLQCESVSTGTKISNSPGQTEMTSSTKLISLSKRPIYPFLQNKQLLGKLVLQY